MWKNIKQEINKNYKNVCNMLLLYDGFYQCYFIQDDMIYIKCPLEQVLNDIINNFSTKRSHSLQNTGKYKTEKLIWIDVTNVLKKFLF